MSLTTRIATRVSNYDDHGSLGSRWRAKRLTPLLEMIDETLRERGCVTIVDLGGTEAYWKVLPSKYLLDDRVAITVVNLPGEAAPGENARFNFVEADACNLAAFDDDSFDIAHSNSVLEHVGDWDRMVRFASEVARVAPQHFIQTPNFWFPVEPHCMVPLFHWLPKPIRVWLVRRFQLGHWKRAKTVDEAVRIVESARLVDRSMMSALFPGSRVIVERLIWLPKSFIAVGVRARRSDGR